MSGKGLNIRRLLPSLLAIIIVLVFLLPRPLAGSMPLRAAPAENMPFAERFGVASSQLSLYDAATVGAELDAVKAAGIAWVRCDFAWANLEPQRGQWDFSGTDRVVQAAQARGVKVLGILGSSPPWANGGNPWNYPPTDTSAWATYAQAVSARYQGQVSAWEIWNEENIDQFWQSGPDAAAYVNLLGLAAPAIRTADPAATVVMGGVAGLDPDYLDACLAAGAWQYIDAIAYHPYAETLHEDDYTPQEQRCRDIVAFVHALVAAYTSKPVQVWLTEFGWTTCSEQPPGVDGATQAAYLLRSLINYADTDVARVIWFNLRDTNLNERDRYGLVTTEGAQKYAYGCYRTFQQYFGPATSSAADKVVFSCANPATLETHCFATPDGGLILGAWKSDDEADTLSFTTAGTAYGEPLLVNPVTGETQLLPGATRDSQGRIVAQGLSVGKNPVLVRFGPGWPAPTIVSITPAYGMQNVILEVTDLAGTGFRAGTTIRIERGGLAIQATDVVVLSDTKITCKLNLTNAPLGGYDLVVRNDDGQEARVVRGFSVTDACGRGSELTLVVVGFITCGMSLAGYSRRRRRRRPEL